MRAPTLLSAALLAVLLPAAAAASDLDELLLRNAIPETRSVPLASDLALLSAIKEAENAGALDYLVKGRAALPEVYYRAADCGKVLTLQGFQAYRTKLSREAVNRFVAEGVPLSKVYGITGPEGESVMGNFGLLSYRGMEIYRAALKGKKEWYAPGEARPPTAEERKAAALLKSGHTELTDPEYSWLRGTTRCSEDTLAAEFGVVALERKGRPPRHFLKISGPDSSATLYSYVYKYRRGQTGGGADRSTAFFGTGAVARKRLCGPDGRPWTGD